MNYLRFGMTYDASFANLESWQKVKERCFIMGKFKGWIIVEAYPLFAAVGLALGAMTFTLGNNWINNPSIQ